MVPQDKALLFLKSENNKLSSDSKSSQDNAALPSSIGSFQVNTKEIKNLIFQGGSVKGIAYLGALQTMERRGILLKHIERVGGTSAGAITAVLLGLGYSVAELDKELRNLDFSSFVNTDVLEFKAKVEREIKEIDISISGLSNLYELYSASKPFAKKLISENALCNDEAFLKWIKSLIKKATGDENITFEKLARLRSQSQGKKFKDIYLVGTNLNSRTPKYKEIFSHEHTPNMLVADAVRISMSIPFVFKPYQPSYYDRATGQLKKDVKSFYIDGGVIDNYPLSLFDKVKYIRPCSKENAEKEETNPYVLGFRLVTKDVKDFYEKGIPLPSKPYQAGNSNNFFNYVLALAEAAGPFASQEMNHAEKMNDQSRTIYIDVLNVGTLDFKMSEITKSQLISEGEKATFEYIVKKERPEFRRALSSNSSLSSVPPLTETLMRLHSFPSLNINHRALQNENAHLYNLDRLVNVMETPFESELKLAFQKSQKGEGKDVVFFLGGTGSGKSSLIAYLMGAKFDLTKMDGFRKAEINKRLSKAVVYPEIGHKLDSQTSYPEIYGAQDVHDTYFCDCPGFFENRGASIRIKTSIYTELALRRAKTRKIVLTLELSSLENERGKDFSKVAETLSKLFSCQNRSIFDSILWVFTKSDCLETDGVSYVMNKIHGSGGIVEQCQSNAMFKQKSILGTDQKGLAENETLLNLIPLLKSINSKNIVVMNMFDERYRKAIIEKLHQIKTVPVEKFVFDKYDSVRMRFQDTVHRVVAEGNELFNQFLTLKDQKEFLTQELNQIEAYIEAAQKTCGVGSASQMKDAQNLLLKRKKETDEWKERLKSEIKKNQKLIDNLKRDRQLLDRNEEEVVWQAQAHKEGKSIFSLDTLFMGGVNEHHFAYPGPSPFSKVYKNHDKSNGVFILEKNDGESGVYESTYRAHPGCEVHADVKLTVERKYKLENALAIKSINAEIKEKEEENTKLAEDIVSLEKEQLHIVKGDEQIDYIKTSMEKLGLMKKNLHEKLEEKLKNADFVGGKIKERLQGFYRVSQVINALGSIFDSLITKHFMDKFEKVMKEEIFSSASEKFEEATLAEGGLKGRLKG